MKNRVVIALMLSTMLISGCGKKEVVDSIPQNDVGQVEEIPEDSYKSNDVVYDLKLVDEMPVDRVEQSANESQPITYEEIQEPESVSDATEEDEVVSVGEEEAVSDTMLDNEADNLDINVNDFVKKIYMPDKFVANINLGIPGMGILIGEADGYKLSGVESCFMWESANGTFYKDAKGVKSVNVDGRSTMFVDSGESKDSDDADGFGMSPNMDIVSSGDFEDLIGNTDEIEFVGQEEFNGIDCFAFTAPATTTTDDSEDGEVTLYVNSRTGALCGITAEEDGFIMTGNVLDYYEFVGDLEKEVSGSIEDGDATEAVGNGLMGAIFGMLFTGMSGGMTMD